MSFKACLSYSSKDKRLLRELVSALKRESPDLDVEYDDLRIQPTAAIHKTISMMLDTSDLVVALLTESGSESKEVHDELVRANDRNIDVLPLVQDGISADRLPWFLRDVRGIKFTKDGLNEIYPEITRVLQERSATPGRFERGGRIAWSTVLRYVGELAGKLRKDGFEPDALVSFPKGGLIVADLLGHEFQNRLEVVSIYTCRFFDENREYRLVVKDDYVTYTALRGKKILIVDDALENGKTVAKIKNRLRERSHFRKEDLRVAVLGRSLPAYSRLLEPDYYSFDYFRDDGIPLVFPWGEVTL